MDGFVWTRAVIDDTLGPNYTQMCMKSNEGGLKHLVAACPRSSGSPVRQTSFKILEVEGFFRL